MVIILATTKKNKFLNLNLLTVALALSLGYYLSSFIVYDGVSLWRQLTCECYFYYYYFIFSFKILKCLMTIDLKSGPVRRVDPGAGRPGARTGPSWWKNRISHDPVWPGRPGKTRLKTRLQHVDFCFFYIKMTPFWIFLKIEIDPDDPVKTWWPDQNPEPGPWTGPGLKTLLMTSTSICPSPTTKKKKKKDR